MKRHIAIALTAAIACGLTGCSHQAASPAAETSEEVSTVAATPTQSGTGTATPGPAPTSSQSTGEAWSTPATTAPDGTVIPGGKVTWLADLPDPRDIDRSDPDAVIRAYIITANTWDTTVDLTTAYATQRATIYQPGDLREAAEIYDVDTAKAQALFIAAAEHDSYTTVNVREVITEGLDPDQEGTMRRIVHFIVNTIPRDESDAPDPDVYNAWLTLTQEDGNWYVTTANTEMSEN